MTSKPPSSKPSLATRIGALVRAIEESDEAKIEEAVLRLGSSRRIFAPLSFAVGAFTLLFDGLKLLVSNWRLTITSYSNDTRRWVFKSDQVSFEYEDNGPYRDVDRQTVRTTNSKGRMVFRGDRGSSRRFALHKHAFW